MKRVGPRKRVETRKRRSEYDPIWSIFTDGSVKGEECGSGFCVLYEEEIVYEEGFSVLVPQDVADPVAYCELFAVLCALRWAGEQMLYDERIVLYCSKLSEWPGIEEYLKLRSGFHRYRVILNHEKDNLAHETSRRARTETDVYVDLMWKTSY
jgi:hypothetical protein